MGRSFTFCLTKKLTLKNFEKLKKLKKVTLKSIYYHRSPLISGNNDEETKYWLCAPKLWDISVEGLLNTAILCTSINLDLKLFQVLHWHDQNYCR